MHAFYLSPPIVNFGHSHFAILGRLSDKQNIYLGGPLNFLWFLDNNSIRPVATYGQVRPWPYHIYGELAIELVNMQK